MADRYVEIWDDSIPPSSRGATPRAASSSSTSRRDLDRDILADVARQLGTRDFDVIHPGLMYRLFTLYWSGQRAMGFVDAHTRFTHDDARRR